MMMILQHCKIPRYFPDSSWLSLVSYPSCGYPCHVLQHNEHACTMLLNTGVDPNTKLACNSFTQHFPD